jgi:molybdopterin-guanine dinucleotide biosynthesis protein A
VTVGGRRLVDRVREAIGRCDPVLLSVGSLGFEVEGLEAVHDLPGEYKGPIAGLAAALVRLSPDPPKLLLTVAVDTPFFPLDFVRRAGPLIAGAPAVIGAFAGQTYPTNGLWKIPAIRDLPQQIAAGTAPHSLKRLAESLGAAPLDYAESAADDPFANVNSPEDLALLEARAAASGQGPEAARFPDQRGTRKPPG